MTSIFFKPKKNEQDVYLKIDWEAMLQAVKNTSEIISPWEEIRLICKIAIARSLDNGYRLGFDVNKA